eukprot:TRINITY_DN2816_c0_g1_i1.p1 TRINITY_DN2816_c0_g1~~TRINITY_DN2816_c0_g1_i1.p1  ORF type:complete len:154 (-),score=18.26 TRINITY_DN2816_c0_g1_i1:36-461(-)
MSEEQQERDAEFEALLIERWKVILAPSQEPWFVFSLGTAVIIPRAELEAGANVTEAAITLMKQWPVVPGCELGDFNFAKLKEESGISGGITYSGHPHILTYVDSRECDLSNSMGAGLYGRSKRHGDAINPIIIYSHNVEEV